MIRNTNRVKVIIRGLTAEEQAAAESLFTIRLESDNWKYNFDNSIRSGQAVTYIPEYKPGGEEEEVIAFFYSLRLFSYDEETMLSLRYRSVWTGRVSVIERPLVPYLLREEGAGVVLSRDDNEFLDRRHEHEVIFIIEVDANGEIIAEEWDRIHQEEDLGD